MTFGFPMSLPFFLFSNIVNNRKLHDTFVKRVLFIDGIRCKDLLPNTCIIKVSVYRALSNYTNVRADLGYTIRR